MQLTITSGITEIADGAYSCREDIEALVLPDSLERIGTEAFSGCTALKQLICPPALREIAPAAFMNCSALKSIYLPDSITEITEGCFLECESLSSLRISPRLEAIGALALQSTALEEFSAPQSLRFIGEQAFWDCPKLREVNVPNAGCVIELDAFGSCYELTRGYIAAGYCGHDDPVSNLFYTLLTLSCPEKHSPDVVSRAETFAQSNERLIMEWVLEHNNAAAMTGLMKKGLISAGSIGSYVAAASDRGCTEITALLLKSAGMDDTDGEFEL